VTETAYDGKRSLALVEYFYSVQGEGANTGRAAFFIRFAGCNLNCVFADGAICDTPWQKAREKLTIDQLIFWMKTQLEAHIKHPHDGLGGRMIDWFYLPQEQLPIVILTGGEPTMAPAFDELVKALKHWHFTVAVESNGTRWREGLEQVDHLVVSPKDRISHNNPLGSPELDPRVVALPPAEYRYVITGADDTVPPFYPAANHFVSPALASDGSGMENLTGTPSFAPGAVDRCLEIVQADPRWRLSLQTHKWILVR
jgi:organic radical activating enzyme